MVDRVWPRLLKKPRSLRKTLLGDTRERGFALARMINKRLSFIGQDDTSFPLPADWRSSSAELGKEVRS